MTKHNGQAYTLADFRGKAVALFFGYTHHQGMCPLRWLTIRLLLGGRD